MSEVTGTAGPSQARIETDRAEAPAPVPPGPPIDTGRVESAGPPPATVPPLPPAPGAIDYGLAGDAMDAMARNVGVDFGRIAALMMQIDSELARAARDSQVSQIESVASEMHASADDIRASARMALAGGVVSGASQIASAGISIGGGIQGMRMTSPSAAVETVPAETVSAPEEPAPTPTTRAAAASEAPGAATLEGVGTSGTGESAPSSETETGQVRAETTEETVKEASTSKQKMATRRLDHTLSQQLSARAQSITMLTEGLSKMTSAAGELVKSAMEYESKQSEADSKEDDARAEEQRAYLDRTKAFADSMQKGAQDMLQAFQQMEEGMHETNRAVWSRA